MNKGELQKPPSIAEFKRNHKPLKHAHKAFAEKMSKLDKIAVWITQRVGTISFFLVILIWTVLWLGWNTLAPKNLQFDPPIGFVLWLFISNLIQILLMPLIMVGQNIQGKYAEMRAEHDLQVNIKAEEEVEIILQNLEYQNHLLTAIVEKMGIDHNELVNKKK